MTVTVRPPLVFLPNPRPKWWGTNPDPFEHSTWMPPPQDVVFSQHLHEGVPPPGKYPPHGHGRLVGPQRPFRFYPLEFAPKKKFVEQVTVNITALLPVDTPPFHANFEGRPAPHKRPPHIVANERSAPTPSAMVSNIYPSAMPLKVLPPPIPVRSAQSPAAPPPALTNLAQMLSEFDAQGLPKKYPPESVIFPPIVLNIAGIIVPPPPHGPEYPSKPKSYFTEEAAYPNVASLPPLIGIAQALDDFSPTGLPKKRWFADPPFPNVVIQPQQSKLFLRYYLHQWRKKDPWPEDAAPTNVSSQPIFIAPGFSYEYPARGKKVWPIEPAPQDFWALPNTAIPPALYDYPAMPAKKWWPDGYPITNWVQEAPALPLNPPPLTFEWPRKLIVTLDDYQLIPPPAIIAPIPIYIPEVGYEIYIPPRRFTIATPIREFFITVPWRTFTVSRKTMQTFDVKDPTENWPLSFNMEPDLFSGETLIGPISVTVTLIQGADPNPTGILNGLAGFNQTQTIVVQPVTGGIAGCSYELIVTCPTTNPLKILTLRGVLPVQI